MSFMKWLLLKLCCFIKTVIVRLKSSVLLWLRCLRCHSSKVALLKFHLLLPKLHAGICGDLHIAYVLIRSFGTVIALYMEALQLCIQTNCALYRRYNSVKMIIITWYCLIWDFSIKLNMGRKSSMCMSRVIILMDKLMSCASETFFMGFCCEQR